MATISENLQTIKSSTESIKQAIIDKGGTIEGDITTWASAISGISGGGSSSDEEYVFTGTLGHNGAIVTVTGNLNKLPNTGRNYLLALCAHPVMTTMLCYDKYYIANTGPYTLTIDFDDEMSLDTPAICILNIMGSTHTVIPVRFENSLSTDPA